MKLLLVHRYFAPDTPTYAWMLKAIAERLASDGHDVTVLTSQPSYNRAANIPRQPVEELVNGVKIRRARLLPESKKNFVARGLNLLLFMLSIFRHVVFSKRYDVVMAATTPPVFVAMTARIASGLRGAKFFYHCQDLHPELTLFSGMLKEGLLYRVLRKIDRTTVSKASRVIVLSEDMANTLRERTDYDLPQIRVINNFMMSDPGPAEDSSQAQGVGEGESDRFEVIFAGNIGYFQGLEVVIEAAKLLKDNRIHIVMLGDGAARARLMEQAGDLLNRRITFKGHVPASEAETAIRAADVCLITLGQGIIKTAYPSKTITYLAQGRPLLVVVEQDSELAQMVVDAKIGCVSAPADAAGLANNINFMFQQRNNLHDAGITAREKALELFGKEQKMSQWSELFSSAADHH